MVNNKDIEFEISRTHRVTGSEKYMNEKELLIEYTDEFVSKLKALKIGESLTISFHYFERIR